MKLKNVIKVLMFQALVACGPGFQPISGDFSGSNSQSSTSPNPAAQAQKVLELRCASCHNAQFSSGTSLSYVTEMPRLGSSQFVVAGKPELSPLYQRIANGTMPPGAPMSASETALISNWIHSLAAPPPAPTPMPTPFPTPTPTPTPPPPVTGPTATFSYISKNILQPKCVGCHGGDGGYFFTNYSETMKAVSAGSPTTSRLYTSVNTGRMPKGTKLSATEIKLIYDWIAAGALNN